MPTKKPPPTPAAATKKSTVKNAPRPKRESATDRADRIVMALVGARAAVITTKLVLQGNSIYDEVACVLNRGALAPLDDLIAEFRGVRS
jgi:hypothetical protein